MRLRFTAFCLSVLAALVLPAGGAANAGNQAVTDTTAAHAAATAAPREDDWWRKRHESFNERAAEGGVDLVFLGDSITHGWEKNGKEIWDEFYAPRDAANCGISGDRTEHVLWRIENGNLDGIAPELVVITIGTNNASFGSTPDETADGVAAILKTLGEKVPDAKILLLGIFPRGESAEDGLRKKNAETNRMLQSFADWERVHFLDIGHVFLAPGDRLTPAIMPDFLHLSRAGYRKWAEAIEAKVSDLLGEENAGRFTLCDGESLEGWRNDAGESKIKGWEAKDGGLRVSGKGDSISSASEFEDFDLDFEWNIEKGSIGGVNYRWAPHEEGEHGPEYQIADDAELGMPADALAATAAAFGLYSAAANKYARPAGEWNHSRIVVEGPNVEHWLNGALVLAYRLNTPEWRRRVARSKYRHIGAFGRAESGRIRLQNYQGNPVAFRDILITVPIDGLAPDD